MNLPRLLSQPRHMSYQGQKQKNTNPGAQSQVSYNFFFDNHFTLEFPMGHRLLFRVLRRSMTACFQGVSARLCDFPDLSSD